MPKRTVQGDGKKLPLNMRTTASLRKKIDKAARASGRSLVAEVEYRVELGFAHDLQAQIKADLHSINRRLSDQHAFHQHIIKHIRELHEAIVLIAILQRDKDLSMHEHNRLRALTDSHGFRPTNGEVSHG